MVPSQSHDICNDIDIASCGVYDVTTGNLLPLPEEEVVQIPEGTDMRERPPHINQLHEMIENPMTEVIMSVLVLLAVISLCISVILELSKRKKP